MSGGTRGSGKKVQEMEGWIENAVSLHRKPFIRDLASDLQCVTGKGCVVSGREGEKEWGMRGRKWIF